MKLQTALWVVLALLLLVGAGWLLEREARTRQAMGAYVSATSPLIQDWKDTWRRAELASAGTNPPSLSELAEIRAAFLEIDPPDKAWEFHTSFVLAMDAAIELSLASAGGASQDTLAAKRYVTAVYSRQAAHASQVLGTFYAQFIEY